MNKKYYLSFIGFKRVLSTNIIKEKRTSKVSWLHGLKLKSLIKTVLERFLRVRSVFLLLRKKANLKDFE